LALYLIDNPVMRAELKHQQHVMTTSRSGRFWIALAMLLLIPAFLSSGLFLFGAVTGIDISGFIGSIGGYNLVIHLIIMNVALYAVVTLITMGLASNSIGREQTGHTWESLLLTTMDARQIIWGKWWATVRSLWGDHIMVGLLRIGLVAWGAIEWSRAINPTDRPNFLFLLIAIVIVSLYTLVDAAFSAVLGLLTPLSGFGNSVFILMLGARVGITIAILLLVSGIASVLPISDWQYILAAFIGLLVLILVTLGALRFAEMVAVWGHATPVKASQTVS
jgi:hypothetical protein